MYRAGGQTGEKCEGPNHKNHDVMKSCQPPVGQLEAKQHRTPIPRDIHSTDMQYTAYHTDGLSTYKPGVG